MTVPYAEIQNLAASAVLELFVLDATPVGGGTYYFHAGTNQLGTSVTWQGQVYQPMPIEATGFEWSSKGTLPRPKLRVSALDGLVGGLVRDLEDLVGAKVTRKMCFAKHLDAVNFPGGYNPNADPNAHWADEPWVVERKTLEDDELLEFELVCPMDQQNSLIPKRRVNANVCPWVYKGTECGYSGPLSSCLHTLADCQTHFQGITTGTTTLQASAGGNSYVRSSGSFIADGFKVGQYINALGFTNPDNNGGSTVLSVSALALGVDRTLVNNALAAGRSITLAAELPFGAFPGCARVR